MGLFDAVAGQLVGALTGANQGASGNLMEAVTGLLTNPQTGGLQGLISTFQSQGLGDVVASWVGTGQNLPITAEQLQAVLGNEQVQSMAKGLGISPDLLGGQLAQLLPQVVDKLTPNGEVPQGDGLGAAMGLIGQLLKG